MLVWFLAFDLAVALMELDEVCELVTDPKYAYGKAGKYDILTWLIVLYLLLTKFKVCTVSYGPNLFLFQDFILPKHKVHRP